MSQRFDEGCQSGHYWHGSSLCSDCGARLRCICGVYVREDNLETHEKKCRWLGRIPEGETEACPDCGGIGNDDGANFWCSHCAGQGVVPAVGPPGDPR